MHLSLIHKMPLRKIAKETISTYSTVRQTITPFKRYGRTNKLLTLRSKEYLYALRQKHLETVAERRALRMLK